MDKKPISYAVVDAFTDTPFKGNPAAVCFLEEGEGFDGEWMQSVANEFNLSETAFLTRAATAPAVTNPRFHLRWFTPVAEVDLCGHATLASAHFLLTSGITEAPTLEFVTRSGILTATKVDISKEFCSSEPCTKGRERFSIELNFPLIEAVNCDPAEIPSIPNTLNGASVVNAQKANQDDRNIILTQRVLLLVELSSGEHVGDLNPDFEELRKCAGDGIIITAPAPPGSGFDFLSRYFCPKFGINEDPVTGSAHCLLAPYWSKKLGKQNLIAYQASARGGILQLQLDEQNKRVRIRGKAVTVMAGTLFA